MNLDSKIDPNEIREFLQKKYGPGIQVEVFPQAHKQESGEDEESIDEEQVLEFTNKPSDIKKYLDRFVIRQDDAKKVLATAICDHYHQLKNTDPAEWRDYKKQNIILIGPTGVGKTYLVQNIARLIGVPFVKADATKYSETGYVGGDVEDLVRELVSQAKGNVRLAECGIVYLDEIDKIASPVSVLGRDVSGHGVQRNLLKLMEETEVPLRSSTDIASQMHAFLEFQAKGKVEKKTINTRHILFIVSGAFNGLADIIKKRIGSKQIGFTGEKTTSDQERLLFDRVRSVDFIECGFEAEFVGRLPVVVHCSALTVEDLFEILKFSEGSILKQYKRDFLAYGIDVYFTDEGMLAIAEAAAQEETGARGLMSVCEKLFREFKYSLPDSEVKEFVVTRELVQNPRDKLEELLANPRLYTFQTRKHKLEGFASRIRERFGVQIEFTDSAVTVIGEESARVDTDPASYLEKRFRDYEHALNLLKQIAPDGRFVVDEGDLQDLPKTLERWIKNGYGSLGR